ncbi:N-acetylmuramoyl-L-alanine amidase [Paracoccus tegillarcae]|uniref:N-acetylmuramoyl-L-alanine amidase n=1 Tax=Paracoccus tegillarcae TaxID=1529068 RepID=A0A2K9EEX6_9RHOB|nr:N-acetylmuramoyl-L-alanine amidase [Paracoccus tegillarcae]AUH32879.1 N-acetylmuramoyl-L-alanine amidase [Paracoccus tegillarcae]
MTALRLILVLTMALFAALPAAAQDAARLDLGASSLTAQGPDRGHPRPMQLRLTLDRAVPYRVFLLDGPPRLVIDLKDVDFDQTRPEQLFGADLVPAIRWGRFQRGWSRIVTELPGPYAVTQSGLSTRAMQPVLTVALKPVQPEDFRPRASASTASRTLPEPATVTATPDDPAMPKDAQADRLIVALDPGHGGIDPGALAGGESEARIVLDFAHAAREALERAGIGVFVTREEDRFMGLEARMTAARAAGADLFISLHADALPAGQAAGATIYLWDPTANNAASRLLAQRHDRDDLLAGLDLTGTDDALAGVLMDIARTETQPRSENFAKFLASRMALAGIDMHSRPVQGARFSVLKSPDIPSVLLELGFLTDPVDRAHLTDPAWRSQMVGALVAAIGGWSRDEGARAALLRQ